MTDFEDGVDGLAFVEDVINGDDAGGVAGEAGDAGLIVDDVDGDAAAAEAADDAEARVVATNDERAGDSACCCAGGCGGSHLVRLNHRAHATGLLRFSCGDDGTSWPARSRPTLCR